MKILLGLALGIIAGWLLHVYLPSKYVTKINDFIASCRSASANTLSKATKFKDKLTKINTTKQSPVSH